MRRADEIRDIVRCSRKALSVGPRSHLLRAWLPLVLFLALGGASCAFAQTQQFFSHPYWNTLTVDMRVREATVSCYQDPPGLNRARWSWVTQGDFTYLSVTSGGGWFATGKYRGEVRVEVDLVVTLWVDPTTGRPRNQASGGIPVPVLPVGSVFATSSYAFASSYHYAGFDCASVRAYVRIGSVWRDTGLVHDAMVAREGLTIANTGPVPLSKLDAELYAYRSYTDNGAGSDALARLGYNGFRVDTPGPILIRPDLKAAITLAPTTPVEPGALCELSWLLLNHGHKTAPPSTAAIYLSANGTLEKTADTLLAEVPCGEVDPDPTEGLALNTTVTIPADTPADEHYLLVVADSKSVILELNETNNVAATLVTVEPPEEENRPPVAVALVEGQESATVEQESLAGTTVSLDATGSSDPDGDDLTYAWDVDGDGEFDDATEAQVDLVLNLGTHVMDLCVEDEEGLSATDTVTVTVQDTTPPELTVAGNPLFEQATFDGTMVSHYDVVVTATDICDAEPDVAFDPLEGSTLPLGPNSVTVTATDETGNTATADFIVLIRDTTAPTIIPPPDVTAEQVSRDGTAIDLGGVLTDDLCDVDLTVHNDAPAVFPLGDTTVTWTVVDDSGNVATAAQIVSIVDTTPPEIETPTAVTVEQASHDGTAVDLVAPAATDICDAAPVVASDAPAVFPLGETTVTWAATDDSGNEAAAEQTVTVVDTTPPTISAPPDVTAEQSELGGTPRDDVILWAPTATDLCDADPTVTSDAPELLPLGTTTVTWTAVDDSGNTATATQTVTIIDTTPPNVVIPPDLAVDEADPRGTSVTLGPCLVGDVCDAQPALTNDAPPLFPLGTTAVAWTATDDSGNSTGAAQQVTVVPGSPQNQLSNLGKLIHYGVAEGDIAPELLVALTAKVSAAAAALARDNPNDAKTAINDLKALINQVMAQTGKKISASAADAIIRRADRLIEDLGD